METTTAATIVGGMIMLGAYFKFIHAKPTGTGRRENGASAPEKKIIDAPAKTIRNVQDFYGVDELEKDPEGFGKKIVQAQKDLAMGKEVAVKAAHALFLFRNAQYHDMIVSEQGNIILKHDKETLIDDGELVRKAEIVRDFVMPGHEDYATNITLPYFVKEVQPLSDGGVRWVFTDEHARNCGFNTVCFDRNNRAIPDPDLQDESDGSGKQQKRTAGGRGQKGGEPGGAVLADMSKKITVLKDMIMEQRAAQMLGADDVAEPLREKPSNAQVQLPAQEGVSDGSDAEDKTAKSTLSPAEYVDELEAIAMEIEMPDFDSAFFDEQQANSKMQEAPSEEGDPVDKNARTEPAYDAEEVFENIDQNEAEDENADVTAFEYSNKDDFIRFVASRYEFGAALLERIFSQKGRGSIYLDFGNKTAMIEKGFFMKSAKGLIDEKSQRVFERDFLKKDAAFIFDNNKVGDLVAAVALISGHPKDIKKRSAAIGNVKVLY